MIHRDDFVGVCLVEWWKVADLMTNGKARFEGELKQGTSLAKKSSNVSNSGEACKIEVQLQLMAFVPSSASKAQPPQQQQQQQQQQQEQQPPQATNESDTLFTAGLTIGGMLKQTMSQKIVVNTDDQDEKFKDMPITFKIWCEETGQGQVMSTYTNVTFEEIKNKALAAAGLAGATDEYRLFASPPAFRSKYCNDLAYDPKDKVAKALRSKTINVKKKTIIKTLHTQHYMLMSHTYPCL